MYAMNKKREPKKALFLFFKFKNELFVWCVGGGYRIIAYVANAVVVCILVFEVSGLNLAPHTKFFPRTFDEYSTVVFLISRPTAIDMLVL